jgi:cytochrome b561
MFGFAWLAGLAIRGIWRLANRPRNVSPRTAEFPVLIWFALFGLYWAALVGLAIGAWALHPVAGIIVALVIVKYLEGLCQWIVRRLPG